jgi:hypothetical protein
MEFKDVASISEEFKNNKKETLKITLLIDTKSTIMISY